MNEDTCQGCTIDYPPGFVWPFRERMLCGVCALEASNQLHGTRRRKFDAPAAEALRIAAMKYRHNPRSGSE